MKVYRISVGEFFYFGSTSCELEERLRTHKRDYERSNTKLYSKIRELGWDYVSITLIKECENGREEEDLLIEENIQNPLCLNTRRASFDRKEYNKKYFASLSKEKITEYAKRTYQNNLEENRVKRRNYSRSHSEEKRIAEKVRFANLTREQRDERNARKRELRALKKKESL